MPSVSLSTIASAPRRRLAASSNLIDRAFRVLLGVLVLTAASRLTLPFWGTPVPFTLGPQAALTVAALLGAQEGVATVSVWLALGLSGAPVFASGLVGPLAFVGPSAGYMLGYVPAAWLVGRFGRTRRQGVAALATSLAAWLGGTAVILVSGAAGIGMLVGAKASWPVAVAPFWFTDGCKAVLAYSAVRVVAPHRIK